MPIQLHSFHLTVQSRFGKKQKNLSSAFARSSLGSSFSFLIAFLSGGLALNRKLIFFGFSSLPTFFFFFFFTIPQPDRVPKVPRLVAFHFYDYFVFFSLCVLSGL